LGGTLIFSEFEDLERDDWYCHLKQILVLKSEKQDNESNTSLHLPLLHPVYTKADDSSTGDDVSPSISRMMECKVASSSTLAQQQMLLISFLPTAGGKTEWDTIILHLLA
jgi:hypothetical protein